MLRKKFEEHFKEKEMLTTQNLRKSHLFNSKNITRWTQGPITRKSTNIYIKQRQASKLF